MGTDNAALNPVAVAGVQDAALARLLSDQWEAAMARSPEWASSLGDHRYDDRLSDRSAAAYAADVRATAGFVARAEALDPSALGADDRRTLALFLAEQRAAAGEQGCQAERWSLSTLDNPVAWLNRLAEQVTLTTPEDGQRLLTRYRALPAAIQQAMETTRLGAAEGRFADVDSVQRLIALLEAALAEPLEQSQALSGLVALPASFSAAEGAALRADVSATLLQGFLPALRGYIQFLKTEILPFARSEDAPGLASLPGGADCYAALIRRHTSLSLSPDQIHQIGLDELDRIHRELRALGERLFGVTDRAALFKILREEPSLYFETELQVEETARAALARAEAAMPRFFKRQPATACEVRRIPDYEAPYTTIAYYMPPVPGERPGYYCVNTYAPQTRPRYQAEVLAFHESVPGHHTQVALAQEAGALPAFRRHAGNTAFVEGWALYVEQLAVEMDLYSGDLDRLGMLAFDAWRASRLVVDTGLHAQGWSRAEAVDFMLKNTPLAENNVVNEVDRYINWPGQALAYKLGQREIWRLRRESEAALGDRFSLPDFHEVVLSQGAVTLPVLEQQVLDWQRAARAP